MESKDQQKTAVEVVQKILINSYTDETIFQAFQLLVKILQNIINNPQEEKYKSIKKSNATLQKTLFCIREIEQLLETMGFTHVEDRLVFTSTNLEALRNLVPIVQQQVERIQNRHLSKEQKEDMEKQKYLEERRKQLEAELKKKEETERQLKELMDLDKKEQCHREKAKDSKAEKREFGAHTKSWQDIGVDLNRQRRG